MRAHPLAAHLPPAAGAAAAICCPGGQSVQALLWLAGDQPGAALAGGRSACAAVLATGKTSQAAPVGLGCGVVRAATTGSLPCPACRACPQGPVENQIWGRPWGQLHCHSTNISLESQLPAFYYAILVQLNNSLKSYSCCLVSHLHQNIIMINLYIVQYLFTK